MINCIVKPKKIKFEHRYICTRFSYLNKNYSNFLKKINRWESEMKVSIREKVEVTCGEY